MQAREGLPEVEETRYLAAKLEQGPRPAYVFSHQQFRKVTVKGMGVVKPEARLKRIMGAAKAVREAEEHERLCRVIEELEVTLSTIESAMEKKEDAEGGELLEIVMG